MKTDTALTIAIVAGVGFTLYWLSKRIPSVCDVNNEVVKLGCCIETNIESGWNYLTGQQAATGCGSG